MNRYANGIADEVSACRDCSNIHAPEDWVIGEGGLKSKFLIVGQDPGADEVVQLRPFIGRSGQLLRTALSEAGINPDRHCLITNMNYHRSLNNKGFGKIDRRKCWRKFGNKLIEQADWQGMLLVGRKSTEIVLEHFGIKVPFAQALQRSFEVELNGKARIISACLHPGYAVRGGGYGSERYAEMSSQILMLKMMVSQLK